MTEQEKSPQSEPKLPEKERFFEAVRRNICQILGFDYGFVDLAHAHDIVNLQTFASEDNEDEATDFIETLLDENRQPLMVANSQLAQRVKETQNAYIGKATGKSRSSRRSDDKPEEAGQDLDEGGIERYPYVILPIAETANLTPGMVRGLLRIISFDPAREISAKDLTTMKLMCEHLASQMPHFSKASERDLPEQGKNPFEKEHVLVVHSNRLVRRRYSRILASEFEVIECDTSEKALQALKENRVDLIVLDSEIKTADDTSFCQVLKDSSEWKHVPVILVTSDTNPAARVDGLNVGADDCLSESCFDSELLARARSSLRHRKIERELAIQLQLLEDYAQRLEQATEHLSQDKQQQLKRNRELELLRWESDILRTQDTLLHRISNTIRQSFNINENLSRMLEDLSGWFNLGCSFVVLPSDNDPEDAVRCEYVSDDDYKISDLEIDLRILELFKDKYQFDQALIVNDAPHDKRLDPFRKGALPDYHFFSSLFVPITYEQKLLGVLGGFKCESQANWNRDNEAFLRSVADQVAIGITNARLYARVQRQATTDGLTGLFNHRTGQEKLSEQLRMSERYQRNLSVVMVDVDHFKSINDNYGHPTGDTVLKSVARLVRGDCRDVDVPVRYGGEEFLLILPEINAEGAAAFAERIRKNLMQEVIRHEDIHISVTASFGIASFPEDAQNQQHLLDLADKALYLSKRLGRNQVHTAGDLMFEEIVPKEEAPKAPESKKATPTYSDFTGSKISADAEQKEELVPEVVEMVKALATSLYSKSEYNKQHHLETARLSELLAKVMGLNQTQVEQIRVAGLLHDVGTLSIPSDIINKQGPYTTQEREIINQHTMLGAQLLKPIRALRDICEILENHHERWDGTGYPQGLKGEEIPLPARIVSIVDSYHAMISDRPYRKAMTHDEAVETLRKGAGNQWDPFLVDIFAAVLASLKEGQGAPTPSLVSKSSGATPLQPPSQGKPEAQRQDQAEVRSSQAEPAGQPQSKSQEEAPAAAAPGVTTPRSQQQGTPPQGASSQGASSQGASSQGASSQGASSQGTQPQGTSPLVTALTQGAPVQGTPPQISSPQISSPQISSPQISSPQTSSPQIPPPQISSPQISSPQISSPQISSPQISSPQISSPQVPAPGAPGAVPSTGLPTSPGPSVSPGFPASPGTAASPESISTPGIPASPSTSSSPGTAPGLTTSSPGIAAGLASASPAPVTGLPPAPSAPSGFPHAAGTPTTTPVSPQPGRPQTAFPTPLPGMAQSSQGSLPTAQPTPPASPSTPSSAASPAEVENPGSAAKDAPAAPGFRTVPGVQSSATRQPEESTSPSPGSRFATGSPFDHLVRGAAANAAAQRQEPTERPESAPPYQQQGSTQTGQVPGQQQRTQPAAPQQSAYVQQQQTGQSAYVQQQHQPGGSQGRVSGSYPQQPLATPPSGSADSQGGYGATPQPGQQSRPQQQPGTLTPQQGQPGPGAAQPGQAPPRQEQPRIQQVPSSFYPQPQSEQQPPRLQGERGMPQQGQLPGQTSGQVAGRPQNQTAGGGASPTVPGQSSYPPDASQQPARYGQAQAQPGQQTTRIPIPQQLSGQSGGPAGQPGGQTRDEAQERLNEQIQTQQHGQNSAGQDQGQS